MIRIGICDDSSVFLQQTKFMIDHWDDRPQNISTEIFNDGDALIRAHNEYPFDIILLDIMMPLLNGIETARELREKDKTVKIVFLTSSIDFAVESYSVKASNYLIKPVSPIKLFSCLDELLSEFKNASRSILIKGLNATHQIRLSDIEHVEAQGKHIVFFLEGYKTIRSLDPLYTYNNKLVLEDGFFKCHRSYIVNMHYIDSYTQNEIVMRSGFRVPISRSCQKQFENVYFELMFGKVGDN